MEPEIAGVISKSDKKSQGVSPALMKRGDRSEVLDETSTIDPTLLDQLRFCGEHGKTGVLRVASADGKAGADLYFEAGMICRLDFNDITWLPLEEMIEDKIFSLLRWRSPVTSWFEGEPCPAVECRVSVAKLFSLLEDKGLNQSSEEWDLKTCELYRYKQVPILPLEIVVGSDDEVECCRIEAVETVIGRNPEAGAALYDPSISRQHALLRCSGGRLSITDLNSSNGTFLNGKALEPMVEVQFKLLDDLKLGRVNVRLRNAEPMTVAAYKLAAERQLQRHIRKNDSQAADHWLAPTKLLPRIPPPGKA